MEELKLLCGGKVEAERVGQGRNGGVGGEGKCF